jgi:hypothetical protein
LAMGKPLTGLVDGSRSQLRAGGSGRWEMSEEGLLSLGVLLLELLCSIIPRAKGFVRRARLTRGVSVWRPDRERRAARAAELKPEGYVRTATWEPGVAAPAEE